MQKILQRVRVSFSKIKEELEDHLLAINENTNEIASNYEYICMLESKIERLTQRVDVLQLKLMQKSQSQETKHELHIELVRGKDGDLRSKPIRMKPL